VKPPRETVEGVKQRLLSRLADAVFAVEERDEVIARQEKQLAEKDELIAQLAAQALRLMELLDAVSPAPPPPVQNPGAGQWQGGCSACKWSGVCNCIIAPGSQPYWGGSVG